MCWSTPPKYGFMVLCRNGARPLALYASPLQLESLRIRSARAVGNSAGNFRNSVAVNRFPDLVEMGSLSRSIASRTCRSDGTKSRQFELARPRIVGALFDLVVDGLLTLPGICRDRLLRMADFALWATACEA